MFGGNTTPIPLNPEDRTRANTVYDHWGQSIDSYERSLQVSAFLVEIRRVHERQLQADTRRNGGFEAIRWQGELQFMPPRWKRHDFEVRSDRH